MKKRYKFNLSFTFSADGVSSHSSNNISHWPLFLIVNEIKKEKRFLIENLCLVSMTNKVFPDLSILLSPLVFEMKKLLEGIHIENIYIKAVILTSNYDIPGRGKFTLCKYSGYYACPVCLDVGTYYKNSVYFPYDHNNPERNQKLRTIQGTNLILNNIKNGNTENNLGIQGVFYCNCIQHSHLSLLKYYLTFLSILGITPFHDLSYYNLIYSTGIDIMHNITNLSKTLLDKLLNIKYKNKRFYIIESDQYIISTLIEKVKFPNTSLRKIRLIKFSFFFPYY